MGRHAGLRSNKSAVNGLAQSTQLMERDQSSRSGASCHRHGLVIRSPGSHDNVLSNRPCTPPHTDASHKGFLLLHAAAHSVSALPA